MRVNEEARALLSDARLLNSSSSQLAEGVAESEERMTEVERVADEDRKVIASVTTTAQTVIAVARDLRSEIRSLLVSGGGRGRGRGTGRGRGRGRGRGISREDGVMLLWCAGCAG